MLKSLVFWASLLGVLASWELVLIDPARILYWLLLCLISASTASLRIGGDGRPFSGALMDRISVVLFAAGVFWWLLWLDFEYVKFAIGVAVWAALAYGMRRENPGEHRSATLRLMLFFGGTFVWSVTSFGLLTVIGWQLAEALAVFIASFGVLAYSGLNLLAPRDRKSGLAAYLVLFLLGVEFFSVVAWLPFTEVTLALVLTVLLLASYDLIKYYVYPERIRKRIIAKKLIMYAFFLSVVLVSTPWV